MSKKAMTLVVIFVALAATTSAGAVDLMATSLGKIDAAYARGEIDYDHAVTYKYLAITTGASKYVPGNLLGTQYSPVRTSGTPAVVEIRAAWPYLSADCKAMVADFHGWGVGETWGNTTWRPTPWGNTSYGGFQTGTYTGSDSEPPSVFLIHWATAGEQQPNVDDYDDPGNPHNQDPEPVPDMAYFSDVYYNHGYDTYLAHGWYDFSAAPEYEDWFPLRDYYADYDPDTEGDQPFPGGDYDYGGDDFWDVYLGDLGTGIGGVTYIDNAFPLTPWYAYSAYCCEPNGDYDQDWDWDNSFNLPEASVHEFNHVTQFMYDALEASPTTSTRWYLEATAMWSEMLNWPDPRPYGYLRDVIQRWGTYLTGSVVTLGGSNDGGYIENIINFFLEDWSSRDWIAPDWTPPPADPGFNGEPYAIDNNIVREMWRATSGPGDPFFTGDETINRDTYEALDFVISTYHPAGKYRTDITWPAWAEAYYAFSSWNWFLGNQDDGRYRYGAHCPVDHSALAGNFLSGNYPVEDAGTTKPMDFFSHAYISYADLSSDAVVATWDTAVASFYGNPDVDDGTKRWMGGLYATTDNGSNWGNLSGTQGLIEPTFDVADFSIIQIDDPSQYDALSYLLVNVAEEGEDTFGFLNFKEVTETTPPIANVSVVRPQINPDYLEIIVGSDEDLFGVPKVVYDIDYAGTETDDEYGVVVMAGNDANNRSFVGTYVMPIGSSGTGTLDYGVADVNGNITTGVLSLDLGFVSSAGGVVGSDPAFVRVPSGAISDPVHVSIVPLEGFVKSDVKSGFTLDASASNNGSKIASDNEVFGMAYDFGPYWADLNDEVYITLNYADLDVTREDYLSVHRYTASGWEDLGGVIDKSHKRIIAEADSLGIFAIGYGEKKGMVGSPNAPKAYALYQNYPNPATDISIVKYALPKAAHTSIKVYDIKGRIVDVLVDENQVAGEYSLTVDTNSFADGIYLYRMETEDFSAVKKMVIAH